MNKLIPIIILSLLVTSLTPLNAQDYSGMVVVRSQTMMEVDDNLNLSFEVWIQRHSVEDYAAMRLVPRMVSENEFKTFPDIVIQGNNKRKTYDRWLKRLSKHKKSQYVAPGTLVRVNDHTDTTILFNYQIPYELWMDNAVLTFQQELVSYNDSRSLVVFALDGKVNLTPRVPYKVNPLLYFAEPAAEYKIRKRQGKAYLDFHIGRSQIVPTYRRNPQELDEIKQMLDEITTNKDVEVTGLFVEGYASPDGRYETNERLARERANALKQYMVGNFELPVQPHQIQTSSAGEDWDGLKAYLDASDIARKYQVIEIIDNTQNIAQRKAKIQILAGGSIYRTMLQEIYPQLRRVEYQIDFTVKDYSTDEAKHLLEVGTDMLSHKELYLVAMFYGEDSSEFENIILNIIPRQFPNDTIAVINTATQMIARGEYVSAKRLLELHRDNPNVWNNLGVIYMLDGDLDGAKQMFFNALSKGSKQAQHNLNEVEIKQKDNQRLKRYNNQ